MKCYTYHDAMAVGDLDEGLGGEGASERVVLGLRNTILEMIARGATLASTCTRLCEEVEALLPDVTSSVLTVDTAGGLHPLAALSLPPSFLQVLEGSSIGPTAGFCGTSAYLATEVVVTDIESDRRWADYNQPPLTNGLRACWLRLSCSTTVNVEAPQTSSAIWRATA
jgi:hypothetical protein